MSLRFYSQILYKIHIICNIGVAICESYQNFTSNTHLCTPIHFFLNFANNSHFVFPTTHSIIFPYFFFYLSATLSPDVLTCMWLQTYTHTPTSITQTWNTFHLFFHTCPHRAVAIVTHIHTVKENSWVHFSDTHTHTDTFVRNSFLLGCGCCYCCHTVYTIRRMTNEI